MEKERKITNPQEIADLVDSCEVDIRAFLGIRNLNTKDVVQKFLQQEYSIDVRYDENGKQTGYSLTRPFSKAAMEIAGISSTE